MNEQEKLWNSEFGNTYHQRNPLRDQKDFWAEVLKTRRRDNIKSVLELGAGKGDNLVALRDILHLGYNDLAGIEINRTACDKMADANLRVLQGSALDVLIPRRYDLVLTRGFLIHVPKIDLDAVFSRIYKASSRYICLAEYYSPARREIKYHAQESALWTDDFAGKMMRQFPDLKLLKYGFKYHMDGGDDITYFLMEKNG